MGADLNMFFKNCNIAQATSEYAILVAIIIAALLAMQIFLKRGIQARLKDAADYPVTVGVFNTAQYEPGYVDTNRSDYSFSDIDEEMERGLAITRETTTILSSNVTTIIGNIQ